MKKILLVDDSQELRLLYGSFLRRNGYFVIEADSGITGLAMARQHLPDLILSDINMPEGDGASLLRDIRRDPDLRSRQFVFLSGAPDLVPVDDNAEERADDFLLKPVTFRLLLSCLKMRLDSASIGRRAETWVLPSQDPLSPIPGPAGPRPRGSF
jgi:CheY-like chemotaxis protein